MTTTDPRPEKVAVVNEVRERLDSTSATILTEYRGLSVAQLANLRTALRDAGGDFKVYKNTLVRLAVRDLGLELEDLLIGPTALAFVSRKPDGTPGDAVDVAKALKDFGKDNPALVLKGGILGDSLLDADDTKALADVEPRDVLLTKLAGAMQAPMQQFASLLQALPRNFAYGLKALIDQQGGAPAPADDAPADEDAEDEAPSEQTSADEAETSGDTAEEAPAVDATEDTPESDQTEEPAAEAADSDEENQE
ncbi:MAG: 50S ribosomal protein L10 [Acidimicrobiales bacterium]|nr:50S ribosomal protein L10 [Acidimicrobiales bacterium]